jgi:hypothetical protein
MARHLKVGPTLVSIPHKRYLDLLLKLSRATNCETLQIMTKLKVLRTLLFKDSISNPKAPLALIQINVK